MSSTGWCRATQPAKGFLPRPSSTWRRKLPNLPSSQVPSAYFLFFFCHCVLYSYSFVTLASTAAQPDVNTLQARVSELEGQLGSTTRELERLQSVEADLSNSSERLRGELSSLRASHKEELEKVVAAQASTEDALRKERNAAVENLAAAKKQHQEELVAANRKIAAALDGMREMDDLLAGKTLCFFQLFFVRRLLSSAHFLLALYLDLFLCFRGLARFPGCC